jgi:hypothetical protein
VLTRFLSANNAIITPLVLKFACDFIEANVVYLAHTDALAAFHHCHELIRVYASCHSSKSSTTASVDCLHSEDESSEEVLMLLTLLSHLVAKDVIDFSEYDETQNQVIRGISYTNLKYQLFIILDSARTTYI